MKRRGISEPNWLLIITFFAAGVFLGGLGITVWYGLDLVGAPVRIHLPNSQYKFVNSLLAVDSFEKSKLATNKALEVSLKGVIDRGTRDNSFTAAAVYVRDLDAGQWTGINESLQFSPGILLKIPIMMAYYRLAESDPSILNNTITLPSDSGESAGDLPPGDYSVNELIETMITESNDQAALALFNNVDKRYLSEIYTDLGLNFVEDSTNYDFVSTKAYSLFFRVLYNGTYLNAAMSERALALLSRTKNDYGLGAPLPASILISHSKGYRKLEEGGHTAYEIRDCGIIYYPNHPYLVCAMGRGADLDKLKSFLSNVSELVYTDIDYQYKNK